jgi:hypothetical protein
VKGEGLKKNSVGKKLEKSPVSTHKNLTPIHRFIIHPSFILFFRLTYILHIHKKYRLSQKEMMPRRAALKEKRTCKIIANPLLSISRDYKTRTCDLAPPRRVRYQLRQIPIA